MSIETFLLLYMLGWLSLVASTVKVGGLWWGLASVSLSLLISLTLIFIMFMSLIDV